MRIPITRPYFDDAEKAAVVGPLETGWVVQGPNVAEFERLFAEYTGAAYALATSSCTTALHLALAALGVGPGDEVIVPAFTFIASANAVEYQRAMPVMTDIDQRTFNIDVELIEGQISERTKAIMPVSLFGLSADMKPIMDLAERHDLYVVEDAACAVVYRASQPDEKVITTRLKDLAKEVKKENITRQALIIVGKVLEFSHNDAVTKSKLYDKQFQHGHRR